MTDTSNSTDIRNRAVDAAAWSTLSKLVQYVISLVLFAILANLLPPSDFGLLSTVLIFTHFFGMLGSFGLGGALIQKGDADDEHYSSVFWLNLISALLYFGLFILLSSLIAEYFEKDILRPLIMVSSLMFFPMAANVVLYAKLEKALNFKPIFIANTLGLLVSGVIAVGMAMNGYGVWSLVYRSIIFASLVAVVQWFYLGWIPKFGFNLGKIKELWSYGINLTGYQFTRYWATKVDGLMVLKVLGESALGFYSKAIGTVVEPLKMVSTAIGEIMFPAMSALNAESLDLKKIYLDGFSALLVATVPFCIAGYFISGPFVDVVLGPEWIAITPVFKAMFVVGFAQAVILSSEWIFMAKGSTNAMLKWSLVSSILIVISVATALWMGADIHVLAWVYAAASMFILPFILIIAGKLINVGLPDYSSRIIEIVLLGAIMFAGLWGIEWMLRQEDTLLILLALCLSSVVLFVLAVIIAKPRAYTILKDHVWPRLISKMRRH